MAELKTRPTGEDVEEFLNGVAGESKRRDTPRKRDLTLYIMDGFEGYDGLLASLGKFRTGKSCLYIKRLDDVDIPTLRTLIERSVASLAEDAA